MRTLILGLAAALSVTAAQAATYRLGGLEVGQPWSRPAAAGVNGAGYMTVTNRGAAPDTLTAVDSRWRGVGLAVVTPIGGLGPVAPGTSASFVARVTPDCSLVGASPDTLAGRIEIELQAPSGRRRTVRLELDRALELLGTAREACASFVAPADRR